MKFTPQAIPDIILVEPTLHGDDRGYFVETFRQDLFNKVVGSKINFVQDNESKSSKGVLRGLHYQVSPYSQSKLVKVIEGSVLDVAVDIRRSSPTFGHHVAIELSSHNKKQLFVPKGFAHGFVVLSDTATFTYKVDSFYAPEYERSIVFDDKDLKINWKLNPEVLKLSEKDKNSPSLSNAKDLFD
ncbi:dTDP-4-dehydrorhamnose 3,5-epimerase [Candidatus Pseudothioglobus singularis]|uniref:dTDP-4-dehydrorhamnose 3,5-epimerase n=1 Tax=Candidatus Pseudothioglobus singularis PS1 TaxID=1125411 RepID=A0A0M4M396_9GAMM|nr:dTDP-4-dehydrorhamnose 3,5-epimerase [Candidatus Pseudothioglobus singularis]ALE02192.1 dTDP-4-dehydrorhamnose 3,5-epimerase [Candidatus Pseudothioglobus singularis PS1]